MKKGIAGSLCWKEGVDHHKKSDRSYRDKETKKGGWGPPCKGPGEGKTQKGGRKRVVKSGRPSVKRVTKAK